MADANVSQLEINGTTYDICDATARDSLSQDYLPLTAGSDKPLTGSLHIHGSDEHNIAFIDGYVDGSYEGVPSSGANVMHVVTMNDENEHILSRLLLRQYASGIRYSGLEVFTLNSEGATIGNGLGVRINSAGERSYHVTDTAAFRDAINTINKSGDTMDGPLIIAGANNHNYGLQDEYMNAAYNGVPSSGANVTRVLRTMDFDGRDIARVSFRQYASGIRSAIIEAHGYNSSNEDVWNTLAVSVNKAGVRSYSVSDPEAFCTALGLDGIAGVVEKSIGSTSINASTYFDLISQTLSKGVWIYFISIEFGTNSTGTRRIVCLNTTAGGTGIGLHYRETESPTSSGPTRVKLAGVIRPSASTTYYTTVWHDATAAINAAGVFQAIKIAG